MFDILFQPDLWRAVYDGVIITVTLTCSSMALGLVLGTFIAVARVHGGSLSSAVAAGYVFVLRGVPLLIMLFLVYYGLPRLTWLRHTLLWPLLLSSPYRTAIFVLSINNAAYLAETVRSGLLGVKRGLLEAGSAIGMGPVMRFRRVEAPLAFRAILGNLGNETIAVMKASAITSVITVHDLMGGASVVGNLYLDPFTPLVVCGAIYLLLVMVVDLSVARIQSHLGVKKAGPAGIR